MRIISFAIVAVALVAGCNGSEITSGQSVILGVSKLDAPSLVASGNPIAVVLTVSTGGCTSFDHIEVTRDASSAHMIVWGRDASAKGKFCEDNLVAETHSYQFDPPFANSFSIQVDRGRVSPLQATVQVQ